MKRIDPRVVRTKQLVIDAIVDLTVERGYDVNIRDIVEKAQINRSTFYLHFRDKQDALNAMMDEVLSEMGQAVRNPNFTYETVLHEYKEQKTPVYTAVQIFEHVKKYSSLYQTLLGDGGFRDRLAQEMQREIMSLPYTEMEACFISNAIVGLIVSWLKRGMVESPNEMGLWITRRSLVPLAQFGTEPYVGP